MKQSSRNLWLQTITGLMIVILLIWQAQRSRVVELDSGYRLTMGTLGRVLVVASDNRTADASVEAAFSVFDHIDRLMSDYDPNSQLSQVNQRAFREPVTVDADLFEVLCAAKLYSCLSEGAFDITVGPVVQLWRTAKQTGQAPTPEQIADAKSRVGYQNLDLDAQTRSVRFGLEGMTLDLGGIAKGYAIDQAAAAMKQAGAMGGMIDIGGDLICFGRPVGGKPHWFIGLQDPAKDDNLLLRLKLDDRAVATSGDYRRFVVVNNQKHSHIVNPVTADSADTLSSVSVIAPTAMQADALATAVSVLGPDKGLTLVESTDGVEAILIPAAQPDTFLFSDGIDPYLERTNGSGGR